MVPWRTQDAGPSGRNAVAASPPPKGPAPDTTCGAPAASCTPGCRFSGSPVSSPLDVSPPVPGWASAPPRGCGSAPPASTPFSPWRLTPPGLARRRGPAGARGGGRGECGGRWGAAGHGGSLEAGRGHLGNFREGRGLLMVAQGRGCMKAAGLLAFLEERRRPSLALTPYHAQNKYADRELIPLLKGQQVLQNKGP